MIIRATVKTLKVARIKKNSVKPDELTSMPGEWTAGLISLGSPGKIAINYVHNLTRIPILINGKSLTKSNDLLSDRINDFLLRHGFSSLIPIFDLNSPIDIYPSSDRSILAHMNELRRNYVDQFEMFNTIHTLDFQKVEDVYLNYPFSMKSRGSKLYTTKEILEELLD